MIVAFNLIIGVVNIVFFMQTGSLLNLFAGILCLGIGTLGSK